MHKVFKRIWFYNCVVLSKTFPLFIFQMKKQKVPLAMIINRFLVILWYEPRHDKINMMRLQPAWFQTSLCIRAVWSGSVLFANQLYYK
jgi:hypothetical protein